jgi:RNA polymerase sigma-70 factor (ECF subfamily)
LVTLEDQDRSRWDRSLIDEGQAMVRALLRRNRPGPFQIQAAVAAVHSDAATAGETDWGQVLRLYDQLMAIAPSSIVALNRAVAVAEVTGPSEALASLQNLDLDTYHLFHATRAEMLRREGRHDDADDAYRRALELVGNQTERSFLEERRRLNKDR